ncbi:hypothetical protein CMUS01_12709 [Colletotrichum musicola]|uniref:Uncharacterized protein n=1 Tax=Colletotrichum musicola TaxID=2175873 RepID=A0A8H6JJF1_9PEZI|nr:hypothetical protein CMUS01_12709 [Colletotrichum musicola]
MPEIPWPSKKNPFELDIRDEDVYKLFNGWVMREDECFSSILLLENSFDVAPQKLGNVMAISSGSSLFIAAFLLSDPASPPKGTKVRHIMGNVGRPGTTVLVPPIEPRIRSLDINHWHLLNFSEWDGIPRDSFADSTLHIWFTGATQEVDVGFSTTQDKELCILESVVSLHNKGGWVADLDILSGAKALTAMPCHEEQNSREFNVLLHEARAEPNREQHKITATCGLGHHKGYQHADLPLVPIENWDELLETTFRSCIFLAQGNWQARLAATMISIVQKRRVCLLPQQVCWACVNLSSAKEDTISIQDRKIFNLITTIVSPMPKPGSNPQYKLMRIVNQTNMSATESHYDLELFTHTVKVGSDTLKLDKDSGHLCALTKKTATMLKDWGTKGLKAVSGDGAVSLSECRMMVTILEYDLAACFRDQSKYADLIADLRRILREHYILRYLNCPMENLKIVLRSFYGEGGTSDEGDHHTIFCRKNPTWSEIYSAVIEEKLQQDKWCCDLCWSRLGQPPPQPPSPVIRVIRRLAELFCEDLFLVEVVNNLLLILRDHLHGDRNDDRYKTYIRYGNWKTLAQEMRSDWRFLETRLHRPQDQKLKEAIGKAMIDMDRKTFSVHREMFPQSGGFVPRKKQSKWRRYFFHFGKLWTPDMVILTMILTMTISMIRMNRMMIVLKT